uniref:F-box domain-containing protein n=1 Tax=Moniliophthora roreri TaxID=221103 RepID=A0A0W0F237_MONRR
MTSTTDISCLPPEILRLCWSYITDREDVCSLVLVSRQFREMCQPMLFRSFTVDLGYPAVQGDGEEKRGILQRKLVRLQGLQKDARLGKMVRQCYFSAREGHLYTHLEVIQIWVTLLPTFAGLTSLTLDRLSLDGVVCRHLSTLVHLSFLSINGCAIDDRDGVTLPLQRFDYSNAFDAFICRDGPLLVSPETLCILNIHDMLASDMFIEHFSGVDLPLLREITVNVKGGDFRGLFRLLQRSPMLQALTIICDAESDPEILPNSLPSGCVSELSHYEGPICLVSLLAPGRPLQSINIRPTLFYDSTHWDCALLQALTSVRLSSISLESLKLPPVTDESKVVSKLSELLPRLKHLAIVAFDCYYQQVRPDGQLDQDEQGEVDGMPDDDLQIVWPLLEVYGPANLADEELNESLYLFDCVEAFRLTEPHVVRFLNSSHEKSSIHAYMQFWTLSFARGTFPLPDGLETLSVFTRTCAQGSEQAGVGPGLFKYEEIAVALLCKKHPGLQVEIRVERGYIV